ncbi:hypothetical protein N7490_010860 [Penicillium lividum]|nr:hypothetical protein N7490_010860 [Penicillium lividum]
MDSIADGAVEGIAENMEDNTTEHEDEMFAAIDNYKWDDLDDEEEEKNTIMGFDHAFTDAMDPDLHAKDVEGLLSYLGVQAEDPSEPWDKVLLNLYDLKHDLKAEVLKFAKGLSVDGPPYPEDEDYDMPARGTRAWPSQDAKVDQQWQTLVKNLEDLSEKKIVGRTLTKPTGRWNAPLAIIWNYPSWTTPNINWAQVLDCSNPCVGMQYAKLGPNPQIRTQNRIPVRANYKDGGISWGNIFPNWDQMEKKCLEFCRWLNSKSRVLLLIGKENATIPRHHLIEMNGSLECVSVPLHSHISVKLYGQIPQLEILRNCETKAIQHIVLSSFHTQTFLDEVPLSIRAYHDILWNGACALADIPVPRPRYFLRHGSWFRRKLDRRREWSPVKRAITLRAAEKKNGVLLTKCAVTWAFEKTLERNSSFVLVADKNSSYVGAILRMFIAKAWLKQSTETWRASNQAGLMFNTSISNLLKASSIEKRLASSKAKRQTESWRSSEAAQKMAIGQRKACRAPRKYNAWGVRLDAFFRTKQVQDRLASEPTKLPLYQLHSRERLMNLREDTSNRVKSYFKAHVIWWSESHPKGLHYIGDGCPASDDFSYDEKEHPAVKLHGCWTRQERETFEP